MNSYDMLAELMDSVSCGALAFTVPENKVIFINDEARRIVECCKADNTDDRLVHFCRDLILPEDREAARKACDEADTVGSETECTFRVKSISGIIYIKADVKCRRFSDGQEYKIITFSDVTELMSVTKALKRERSICRDAVMHDCEYSFFFDVTDGMIYEEFTTAHEINIIRLLGMELPVKFDDMTSRYVEVSGLRFLEESMRRNFTARGIMEQYESGIRTIVTEYYSPRSKIYTRANGFLSKDEETGHVLAYIIAEDVSGSMNRELAAQRALQEKNELLDSMNREMNLRMDTILDGLSGGFKIIDPDDGFRCLYISEGAAEIHGYSAEEFLALFDNNRIVELYGPEDDRRMFELARNSLEKGEYEIKYRIKRKDGSIRWAIDRAKIVYDSNKDRRLYYILMQDVTELEKRSEELKNILGMQEQMADLLGCGVLAYTVPQRDILIFNQEGRWMFDVPPEITNASDIDLMARVMPDDKQSMLDVVKQLKKPGDKVSYTFSNIKKDGTKATFRCDTKLLEFSDGQQYVLSTLTDITEQTDMEKRLNEEHKKYRSALAMKSMLLFNVDLTDGCIHSSVTDRHGVDMVAKFGFTPPVYYDDIMRVWLDESRIVVDDPDVDIIRSRRKLISAYRQERSVIGLRYSVPGESREMWMIVLLSREHDHVVGTFIFYNISG